MLHIAARHILADAIIINCIIGINTYDASYFGNSLLNTLRSAKGIASQSYTMHIPHREVLISIAIIIRRVQFSGILKHATSYITFIHWLCTINRWGMVGTKADAIAAVYNMAGIALIELYLYNAAAFVAAAVGEGVIRCTVACFIGHGANVSILNDGAAF